MAVFPYDQPVNNVVLATPEERAAKRGRKWMYELAQWFAYRDDDEGFRIVIGPGFRYDGGSVPRIAWTASGLTPDGPARASYLVHDWHYRWRGVLPKGSYQTFGDGWQDAERTFTRKEADQLFRKMMKLSRLRGSQVVAAYWAVRIGGSRW